MPSPRAHHERRHLVVEPVFLAGPVGHEVDAAADGVDRLSLAFDHVGPGRGVGVLEVGHEHSGARVEGVDQHLAVGGPCDLTTPVLEVLRWRATRQSLLPNRLGVDEEGGIFAGIDAQLALAAIGEQPASGRIEAAVQLGHEAKRLTAEDLVVSVWPRPGDFHHLHHLPPIPPRLLAVSPRPARKSTSSTHKNRSYCRLRHVWCVCGDHRHPRARAASPLLPQAAPTDPRRHGRAGRQAGALPVDVGEREAGAEAGADQRSRRRPRGIGGRSAGSRASHSTGPSRGGGGADAGGPGISGSRTAVSEGLSQTPRRRPRAHHAPLRRVAGKGRDRRLHQG